MSTNSRLNLNQYVRILTNKNHNEIIFPINQSKKFISEELYNVGDQDEDTHVSSNIKTKLCHQGGVLTIPQLKSKIKLQTEHVH